MASEEPPLPLAQQLSWRLHRLGKLTDALTAAAYAEELGLGVAEARALAAIGSFEPLSVNQLAAHAHLDKAQASRAAQMLVERGAAEKTPSPSDARAVVLSLTRSGRRLHRQAMGLIQRRNRDIMACLDEAERESLLGMIDRLIRHAAGGHTH
jgi:DNA-binding MarR family transcriptional regulator